MASLLSWLESRTGIVRLRVHTPLKSWLFQASIIGNCINCVHNCEDYSLLESKVIAIKSILFTNCLSLPRSETWIFLIQICGGLTETTWQRYSFSSAAVTLKKINVSLWGNQVAFKRLAKLGSTDGVFWFGTKVATALLPIFIDTAMIRKPAVKLKLQLSSSLMDPLIRLLLVAETGNGPVTVWAGGGSNQVMLPPSEYKQRNNYVRLSQMVS